MMKFGNNLQNLRKAKKLSQEELGEKVGVSRQSVSKWECDESYPEVCNILALCNVFNCDMQDLVSDEEIKKIMDLERMKEQPIIIEGVSSDEIAKIMKEQGIDLPITKNAYEHFINLFEDYYISKSDGMERIKHTLNGWDAKARKTIILALMDRLKESGINFTTDDFTELVKLI